MKGIFNKMFVKSVSYNRMKSYMYEHDVMMVSADKYYRDFDDWKGESNKVYEKYLFDDLRTLCDEYGWKVTTTYGGYQEDGWNKPSNEHSFMIINLNDNPDFRKIVTDFMLMRNPELDQESIAFFPKSGKDSMNDGNNVHRFSEGEGELEYIRDTDSYSKGDIQRVGKFRDKSVGVGVNEDGVSNITYTRPRRYKSHSFAYAEDGKFKKDR